MIIDWISYIVLVGIAFYFMVYPIDDGAVSKYLEEKTTFTISEKPLKELPAFVFCFAFEWESEKLTYGNDFGIFYFRWKRSTGISAKIAMESEQKELKLGENNFKRHDETVILERYKTSYNWQNENHHCYKVTTEISTSISDQLERAFFFYVNKNVTNEDMSWLEVYITSKDNAYGPSFINTWNDGEAVKLYVEYGNYKAVSLKVNNIIYLAISCTFHFSQ